MRTSTTENGHEKSTYFSTSGKQLRRIEHDAGKRCCMRPRRLSRRLRRRRRRGGGEARGGRAAARCGCSPQGVLIPSTYRVNVTAFRLEGLIHGDDRCLRRNWLLPPRPEGPGG